MPTFPDKVITAIIAGIDVYEVRNMKNVIVKSRMSLRECEKGIASPAARNDRGGAVMTEEEYFRTDD
jgi:hypothetical protein